LTLKRGGHQLLITGAAGHLGGRLLSAFVSDTEVKLRVHFRKPQHLPDWIKGAEASEGDLRSSRVRMESVRGMTSVIHLATGGYSTFNLPSQEQLEIDLETSTELARDAARSGVSHFVFVSSVQVYGDALRGDVSEVTVPLPSTAYGRSRFEIEQSIRSFASSAGMSVTVIRLTNTYGVPAFPRPLIWDLFVHDFCRQAVETSKVRIRSDERTLRDVIPIREAVRSIRRVIHAESAAPPLLLVASGRTHTLRDIAEVVVRRAEHTLGLKVGIEATRVRGQVPTWYKFTSMYVDQVGGGDSAVEDEELDDLLNAATEVFARRS